MRGKKQPETRIEKETLRKKIRRTRSCSSLDQNVHMHVCDRSPRVLKDFFFLSFSELIEDEANRQQTSDWPHKARSVLFQQGERS